MVSDQIVDEYYGRIYKLCLFYLENKEEAEDIVQEIFLKVLKKKSTFKEQSGVYTWIYRIAVNTILNYIKRKKIVQFISFENFKNAKDSELAAEAPNPAVKLEQEELKNIEIRKLEKSIDRLSAREKTAFYLFHYENLKQKKIAEIMHTSVSAVESLVHKSMKKIRENMTME
jgi:RNA polymerase sigma-70 factor (ECF subfamily)